jgi:hypothetical protein
MKSLYFTLAVFSLISFQSFAQTFDWVTNDTIETNLALNTTVQLKMEQTAVGNDTVTLGIEVIHNDLPSGWDGMLCIHGSCLGIIPPVGTTGTMSPISGVEKGYVRLTVNPINGMETAKLQVYVFDVDYPNDGDTATWLLNTTVSLDEDLWNDLELYPNPVSTSLNVDTDQQIEYAEIYSLNGEFVVRFDQLSTGQLNVSSIEPGMYLLRLVSANNTSTIRKIQKL